MELVINRCYGGFGLSPLAIERLAELNGKKAYFFDTDHKGVKPVYRPISREDVAKATFWGAFCVENPSDHISKGGRYGEINLDAYSVKRDDPKLVKVVKELGDKANGPFSELSVVEIPDDIEYTIEEYDGMGRVAERHRTWS